MLLRLWCHTRYRLLLTLLCVVESLSTVIDWWCNLISKHIRLFHSCDCGLFLDLLILVQLLLQLLILESLHSSSSLNQEAQQNCCNTAQRNENWCENPSEYIISRILAIIVCTTVSIVCAVSALPRASTLLSVICAITLWKGRERERERSLERENK